MRKVLFSAAIIMLLAGCQSAKQPVTANNLYGDFDLVQFDTQTFPTNPQRPLGISLDQNQQNKIRVQGVLCNNFMGEAVLVGGKLVSEEGLASTRMACFREAEGEMEDALGIMLRDGATVEIRSSKLTLEGNGHKFTFQKK